MTIALHSTEARAPRAVVRKRLPKSKVLRREWRSARERAERAADALNKVGYASAKVICMNDYFRKNEIARQLRADFVAAMIELICTPAPRPIDVAQKLGVWRRLVKAEDGFHPDIGDTPLEAAFEAIERDVMRFGCEAEKEGRR
jgi:hypothetical protein